jgi:transcriptional regulator with XRE-family HTH domain
MNVSLNIIRLKECREKLGITKMEAAKRMKLSQPAYLRYESGTRTPSLQTLSVIADILNTSVDYLTDQSDDPQPTSYTISKLDDPELFEMISICKNSNSNMIKRMVLYAEKLSSIKKRNSR